MNAKTPIRLLATLFVCLAMQTVITGAEADLPGPDIGSKAPEFTLSDSTGQKHALSELLKKGSVAIVFYRSADWLPFCKRQLVELQSNIEKIQATGAQVIGISYDSEEVLRRAVAQQKISFLLLSDSGSKTIDAYGVRNKEAGSRIDGVPHPVTIVVDSKGIVRAKLGHEGYRDRHPSEELIGVLKKIQ